MMFRFRGAVDGVPFVPHTSVVRSEDAAVAAGTVLPGVCSVQMDRRAALGGRPFRLLRRPPPAVTLEPQMLRDLPFEPSVRALLRTGGQIHGSEGSRVARDTARHR